MSDDWRSFLVRWSQEWVDAQEAAAAAGEENARDEEPLRTRWLGFSPAPEGRIRALEERLGHRLPPSYREFLAVSDGWRHAGAFVWLLAGTDKAKWHEDASGLSEYFPGDLDDDPTPKEALLAGMWGRALQLDVESDAVHVLLDPGDVDEDGEWAVYDYASWRASPPERHASFRVFMEAMYREFHRLQVDSSARAGAVFVNATTRTQDASVEAARLDALAGRHEQASAALSEALAFGRLRAAGLRDQIRRLLGEASMVSFPGLTADPLYAPEVLAVLAAEDVRHHHGDDSFAHHVRGASDGVRQSGQEILRQVRSGTYRYTAEGPFGTAVETAREQARWGESDAAWHTLRAALPQWRPLGPEHLAPVGLCADPLLGPLITPERGRELLATPRAGHQGDAPEPAPDLDPPGLAWLTEADPGNVLMAYRFLLVEGVEPAALPDRIGAEEGTALNEPATLWHARMRLHNHQNGLPWTDEALTSVGRAGPGWTFALEARPSTGFDERRLNSPGIDASRGTRAVTVWSEPFDGHRTGFFHLSVAENGVEKYAFTVRPSSVSRQGPVPHALDPDRLFPQDTLLQDRLGERRTLDALAAEFGVQLPRFALTRGRLHTFRTRSWSRPPESGESYAILRITRHRP